MIVVDEAKQVEQQWIRVRENTTDRPIVVAVPSKTEPNKYHLTNANYCDCRGFQYRQICSHVKAVRAEVARRTRPLADGGQAHLQVMRASGDWPAAAESPDQRRARQAAEYHSIFGQDDN